MSVKASPPVAVTHGQVLDLLRALPLFAGTPDRELADLAAQCRAEAYDAERSVFLQGDPVDRVWIVQAGRVKIVRQDEDGRESILEVIQPGEVFGGGAIMLESQPATARALEPTVVVSLGVDDYTHLLLTHPKLALRLIRMLGTRLHAAVELNALTGERVERRLAHILLRIADRCGRPDPEGLLITLALSRQDLADMTGTTLETTIRILSRFRTEGVVRTRRGGYIVLTDVDRLQGIARG